MVFVDLESGLAKVSVFSFPLKVFQSPELRYPFVEVLDWVIPMDPVVVIVPPVRGAVAVIEVTEPTPEAHEKLPLPSFSRKVLAAPCVVGQLEATLLILIRFPVELTWNC